MSNELISVVMSTYNEPEEWIRKSIESILGQTIKRLEFLIVCDNPNNKELINLLEEYKEKDKRIKLIINEKNIGLTKSLNKALNMIVGDFIARMDSDDIAIKDRLEKQLKYLKDNNLDLIGSGVVCIDEEENEITTLNNLPKDNESFKKRVIYNNCMPHPTWFGKAEVFKDNRGYRDVSYAEDYDFLLRALEKGFKLGNIREVLLKYRMRSTSISNKNGLKQFLISQKLVERYKSETISNKDVIEEVKNIINSTTKDDEEKYYKASTYFTKGAMKLKKFNPIGGVLAIRAFTSSKYYRKKIKCYIKGLI